jgi:hypothetical protein
MIKRIFTETAPLAVLLTLLLAGPAAAVELRFTPPELTIETLGQAGSLSIWLDEPLDVRTIEVTVTYDGSILSGEAGAAGAAFADLPCFVWEEYEQGENQWYGFAVAIGADCYVTGPGELYRWDFFTAGYGSCDIEAVSVVLYDQFAEEILDVTLPGASVTVGNGVVPVPGVMSEPCITASPNPCNPMTSIRFWLPEERVARLEVYDIKGRLVRRLLDGPVGAHWSEVRWNGRTDAGVSCASGVYLYRLDTGHEHLTGRVTLAR